jgi:hypothetical protein
MHDETPRQESGNRTNFLPHRRRGCGLLNLRLQSRQAELVMIRSQTELAKLKGGVLKDTGETVKKTSDAAANEQFFLDLNH